MQAEYWQKKWSNNNIGFHQENVNKRLQQHWPALKVSAGASVFVPLCGKSLDMLWLHQQGYQVMGVELSDKAVQAFFNDNHLPVTQSSRNGFDIYTGVDQARGIELWVGDFFELTPDDLCAYSAFYDRASLIAMNESLRVRYTTHLGSIMAAGTTGLLLAIAYDQRQMQGPPFSVPDKTVRSLLGNDFTVQELDYFSGPERLGNLASRGLETLEERVYLLRRTASTLTTIVS